ncbi:LxmA leader domain family RiPP [Streptomyces alfalfae]
MNTADELIAGYTAYTNAEEFGATASGEAPAITPSILSFIGGSSAPCGGAVSSSIGVSVAGTKYVGC